MAEVFLQILLDNLSSLIREEIGTIMGVDSEMKKLSSTLTAIQAVLEDAEAKQLEDKAIRNWLCKLNDLTYEIDDILDECSTEVEKMQHKSSTSSRYSLRNILYQCKIGRRMKEATKKLDDIAKERSHFHLNEIVLERQRKVALTRETGSLLNDCSHVYGRDGEKGRIVEVLVKQVSECQQLSVLSIVGIGGLGKTTLAQLVFNDIRVTERFDIKLWVCVSYNFDLKALIKAMIESATGSGNALDSVCMDALQRHLWELLSQKRYLIVLDDVWNEDQEKWSALKNILACGSSGASIILTTRLKKVADIVSTVPAYYLAGLSNENCWKLFKQRALGQEEKLHNNLESIGKQIVEKCVGVPLAAKTLGGLLRFKRDEKEWVHIKDSDIWSLPHEETSIFHALRLSYCHLSSLLKKCFAYCAVFPKNNEIEKEEVIFQWIAHGYISSNAKLDVEDVGNEIWKELVLRSLFQDVHTTGGKTTFKIHDLVHDLAKSIMENKVSGTQTGRNTQILLASKIRQVNFKTGFMAFPTNCLPKMDQSSIIKKFGHLRSLDASGTRVEDLSSTIGNLKHLRYLNLSETNIHTLPNTICSLWNLKILNLNRCFKLMRLPKHMRYMHNLCHVHLEDCHSLSGMPSKLGKLSFLKTLSMFIVGHRGGNQLEELQWLNLGGALEIKHLERVKSHIDAKKANLVGKQNLRILKLEWEVDTPSRLMENEDDKILEVLEPHPNLESLRICGFKGKNFSFWKRTSNITNIARIDIWSCPNCLRLPQALGELPCLKILGLRNLAVEYIIENEVVGDNSLQRKFPSLENLKLYDLPNLKGLLKDEMRELDIFPNLQSLETQRCPSLILPQLSSLSKLYLHSCDRLILPSISKLENLNYLCMDTEEQMIPAQVEGFKHLTNHKILVIAGAHEQCLLEEELGVLK